MVSSVARQLRRMFRPRHYDGAANADDIYYCFRLLLGRNPTDDEWIGHSARSGEPLRDVVSSYLCSPEFANRNLPSGPASNLTLARIEGFFLWASKDDLDVGRGICSGSYEPSVTLVIRRLLKPGMDFLDVGANIGYYTMLGASIVGSKGSVTAIEPNEKNVRLLVSSKAKNGFDQIKIILCAAGEETAIAGLYSIHSNGTAAPISSLDDHQLSERTLVPQFRIDDIVPSKRRVDLIKIDIEGGEYHALSGAIKLVVEHRPVIVSEFSPPMLSGIDGLGYLAWIVDKGYTLKVIEQNGALSESTADPAAIMTRFDAGNTNHLDIVAQPLPTPSP
jgi:FkbM family methyltransferase